MRSQEKRKARPLKYSAGNFHERAGIILKKGGGKTFQLHLDAVVQLILPVQSLVCEEEPRICNSFLLQFIPVAIHTTPSLSNHSVFQVAVSTCSVADSVSKRHSHVAQDNVNLQGFGDKLALMLFPE